ncbi:MAG: restriction endonuclease [Candidatus Kapaibacterium sp.]
MMMDDVRILRLFEYKPVQIPPSELTMADAEIIFREHGDKIEIEEPTMRTGGLWSLQSKGWVGSIPLRSRLRLHLEPKMPVASIFRMLEYAYALKSFNILEGISESDQIDEIYQRLAMVLARRVLDRGRRGLYRAYVPEEDQLPYVRGSVDIARSLRTPWKVALHCSFQENTADIRENQLLAWTLHTIIRQGICTGERLDYVMAAWRSLRGAITLHSFRPAEYIGWLYNRLNGDYRPLHALCRFFLEQAGPTHEHGGFETIPFLVNMAGLYEKYVAEYLAGKIGDGMSLSGQEEVGVSPDGKITITIDLVLSDLASGNAIAVLDTKYKNADYPSPDDLQQVVAYAVAKNCRRAVLIYPTMPKRPFNGLYGAGHVEVMTSIVSPDGEIGEGLKGMLGIDLPSTPY